MQDEIDALATSRASGDTDSGAGSHEGVLTSLLNEMDGVQELLGVTVVAATNRPDVIVRLFHFSWRSTMCNFLTLNVIQGFRPDASWAARPHFVRRTARSERPRGDTEDSDENYECRAGP